MKTNVLIVGILAVLAVLAGCTQAVQQETTMEKSEPALASAEGHSGGEWTEEEIAAMEKEEMEKKESMMDGEWSAEEIAAMEKEHAETMVASGYKDYTQELFDKAVAEGKVIVLSFSANWCPACQKELPELQKGVVQLNSDKVVVFRVHYKDDQSTDEHTALIKQYQIPYQHTKVVLKDGRMVLKSPKAWSADEFVKEMQTLL